MASRALLGVPLPLFSRVCASQAIGERAHHRNGEEGRLMHEEEEGLLCDGGDLASRLSPRRGGPRRSVDQSHFRPCHPRRRWSRLPQMWREGILHWPEVGNQSQPLPCVSSLPPLGF